MTPPPAPTRTSILIVAVPLLAVAALLAQRRLGQVRSLAVSVTRMIVQLLLLGLVLSLVFQNPSPWVLLGVALVMLLFSSHSVAARKDGRDPMLMIESFLSMGAGAGFVLVFATQLALDLTPWTQPQVVVPLLGMLLGNSVQGVALASERLESELRSRREEIELRLALGASASQASREPVRAAIRAALTPTINSMTIAGVVAIPGMMAGQLLAGGDVSVALRYQILIYLGIAGTVGLSTLMLLRLRMRHYFNRAEQLRIGPDPG